MKANKRQVSFFYSPHEYPGVTPLLQREMAKIVKVRIGPARLKKAKEFIDRLVGIKK